jgi:hypothetical protein
MPLEYCRLHIETLPAARAGNSFRGPMRGAKFLHKDAQDEFDTVSTHSMSVFPQILIFTAGLTLYISTDIVKDMLSLVYVI